MSDPEIQEAALAVLQSTGVSSYLHGVDYDVAKFKNELGAIVSYLKSQRKPPAKEAGASQKELYRPERLGSGPSGQAQDRGYHEG